MPAQKISVEDALRAYTSGSAFASFEDTRKGTLAAGYLADVVILDRDLFTIAPEQIRSARVATTIVGGKIVVDADSKH